MEGTLYRSRRGYLIGLPSLLKYKYWGNQIFIGLSTASYTMRSAAGELSSSFCVSLNFRKNDLAECQSGQGV